MLFFTGFPGFLGSELLKEILPRFPDLTAICLIQKKFISLAQSQLESFPSSVQKRVSFVEGDLTLPLLGLSNEFLTQTAPQITQIFHLAAIYDLNVKETLAKKVNIEGTIHTLDFAKKCTHLTRFQYVSTCYVSGRYPGRFFETDLAKGQLKNYPFNNYYESTKYQAEIEVQKAMTAGLPVTIYRPGIVVGNSITGETQKFDGPYFVLQWLLRQPKKFAILPTVFTRNMPREGHTLDLVPSDFVIKGIAYLSQRNETLGEVFQLADPHPLTVPAIIQNFEEILGKKIIKIPLPLWLARLALRWIPGLEKFMGVPYSALNYFAHPTTYDVSNTLKRLEGSGISAPSFPSYSRALLTYMKAHRHTRSKALT